MTPLEKFYTDDPRWYAKIGDIHALLERVKISEEQSGDALHLRRLSRLDAIGNSLHKYIDVATQTTLNVPANVGVNVGVNDQILELLRQDPDYRPESWPHCSTSPAVPSNAASKCFVNRADCAASVPTRPGTGKSSRFRRELAHHRRNPGPQAGKPAHAFHRAVQSS